MNVRTGWNCILYTTALCNGVTKAGNYLEPARRKLMGLQSSSCKSHTHLFELDRTRIDSEPEGARYVSVFVPWNRLSSIVLRIGPWLQHYNQYLWYCWSCIVTRTELKYLSTFLIITFYDVFHLYWKTSFDSELKDMHVLIGTAIYITWIDNRHS